MKIDILQSSYLHMDKKNKRHTKKVSQMLQDFIRLEPILENFSDIHFRALVLFPSEMTLIEELFSYKFHVQFEILQTMSTSSLQKQLHAQEFLRQFNISNQKKLIIQSLQEIIKSLFKITQKDGSLIQKINLTSKIITKSEVIYLEEIIYSKNSINQLINEVEG